MSVDPPGASPSEIVRLFNSLKKHILKEVNSFSGARLHLDPVLRPRLLRQVENGFHRTIEQELEKLSTFNLLFPTRAKRRLTARVLLYEILKHEPLRIADANGKDVYTSEANVIFAIAASAAQFGTPRPNKTMIDTLASQVNEYRRSMKGRDGSTFNTNANDKIVATIIKFTK